MFKKLLFYITMGILNIAIYFFTTLAITIIIVLIASDINKYFYLNQWGFATTVLVAYILAIGVVTIAKKYLFRQKGGKL